MIRKVFFSVLVASFVLSTASLGVAATVKCEITQIDGNTLTVECQGNVQKFSVGDKIKIKSGKKRDIPMVNENKTN